MPMDTDLLLSLLRSLCDDIEKLSSKKPDAVINSFKLAQVNHLINQANNLLDKDLLPISGFKQFEEAMLPSYSDVVMVLSQYITTVSQEFE